MNQPTEKEETEQLYHILSLLEVTYSSKETDKIKAAQDQLQTFSSNLPVFTNLLFKSLLLTSIKEKPISLELHKSSVIYLRNIILKNSGALKAEEIYESLKKFISLLFSWDKNINLNNNTITTILENIVSFFLSLEKFKEDDKYLESLFSEIKNILMENNSYTNENNILITCDRIIALSKSILTSKNIKPKINEHLLNDYFFPISDKILDLCKNYINPSQNIYNDNYFKILNKLFESFYNILYHLNTFNDSIKDLCLIIFQKYWKFFPELIELNPPLDEINKNKFSTSNPLIILNIDEKQCKEINLMKSKIIQLICYLSQNLYNIANDLDFNKKSKQQIDENITNFLINLVTLTVKCFGDILSNKDKFFFIRDYELETLQEEENSINILLYDLCVLLTRILIRDPFKNIFRKDMKIFLFNILLPLFSTNDTERNTIESDYDMYNDYLIDIYENFKMKNFRSSGLFLISKICNFFGDENSFLLSYILEMFNYTINEGKINNQVNYNIYIENKDKFTIDKLDNETKIDLFFLLILLLRDRIIANILIKNRLRDLLMQNQPKLHQINSLSIKIKLCKIYSTFIPLLFKEEENNNISQKKNYYNDMNKIQNEKDINEKDKKENNTFSEEHYVFIKNAIEYLLKNIEQNVSQFPNINNKNNYCQSLSHSAAESISELIISFKETSYEENEETPIIKNEKNPVIEYISKSLSESFKNIINLIIYIDNHSFYNIIDYVLKYIKPIDRQDIFICLKNITQKFIDDYKNNNEKEESITPFIVEYFRIISDFFKGENKPIKNNKNEMELIEELLTKLFECININELEKFEEYDELIEMMENYIILLEFVNEKSIIVFNKILPIIKTDNTCSNSLFSFLCTFLKYLPKTNNLNPNIKFQLTSEIIKIIKLSLTVDDEILNNSVKHALLLTLKLFNVSINEIPFDLLKELLILSLNSFAHISKEDLFIGNISHKILINQIILTNISFGFIFRPVDTYKIIFEKNEDTQKIVQNNSEDNKDNNDKGKTKKDYNPNLHLFINLIISQIGMATNDYIVLLNKCLILGICSIFKEKYCLEKLNIDNDIKILMIQILAKLIEKHRKQQVDQLNKIMKRETNCNFIEESEYEEEEDEESEELEDFKRTIKEIFSENENIKNADEYNYFGGIINELKKNDNKTYEILNSSFNGKLEELMLIRNIKINYKGKDYKVPRKTVQILKKKK